MQDFPIVEIILAVTGYFIARSINDMSENIKNLTLKLEKVSLEFASFASKTEIILEQHEKDIEHLKRNN